MTPLLAWLLLGSLLTALLVAAALLLLGLDSRRRLARIEAKQDRKQACVLRDVAEGSAEHDSDEKKD